MSNPTPKPVPPRIKATTTVRHFYKSSDLESFLARSCGTDDVSLENSPQRHYTNESWAKDFISATLSGCAHASFRRMNIGRD